MYNWPLRPVAILVLSLPLNIYILLVFVLPQKMPSPTFFYYLVTFQRNLFFGRGYPSPEALMYQYFKLLFNNNSDKGIIIYILLAHDHRMGGIIKIL